ncbi:tetratricopeptide repeat protein [Candidatus Uabimicrobium sp. HlEnr_7]|uniref:tetratricopeptide repeat protein n=1 Tax=Candidatus Uabimicrobium helgolandensis TaxID=3095367 RepID=UPI0035576DA9
MRKFILVSIAICLLIPIHANDQTLAIKAKDLLEKGSYEIAIETFEKFVDIDKSTLGVEGLIEAYRLTGKYDKALSLAKKYGNTPQQKQAARGLMLTGKILEIKGDYPQAYQNFISAYIIDEESIIISVSLAKHYMLTGKKEKALKLFGDIFDNYDPDEDYSAEDLVGIAIACRGYAMNSDEVDRSDTLKVVINGILSDTDYDNGAIEKDPLYFPAYIEMVHLFLEAYNTVDASSTLRSVLKLNPHHPELLHAKAIYCTKNYAKRPEIMPTINHALEINPNYTDALTVSAAVHLSDGEYDRAYKKLQKALQINPNHLESLSWLATYYHLKENMAEYEKIKEKVFKINPKYGEFYHLSGVILAQNFQYAHALEMQRKAIELNPFLWDAYIELGSNLMRTGEEDEAKKHFEKVREEYNFHVQTHNMLLLLEKFKEFKVYHTKNFRIRLHVSEADVLFPILSEHLEKSIEKMSEIYGFVPETPMLWEVYPETKDFSVRVLGLSMIAASGVCFGKVLAQLSPKAMKLGTMNWASVGWHELSHAFTLQMTDHKIPRWFTEGLSEMFERDRNPSVIRKRDKDLWTVYNSGLMRGIKDLNAGFTRPKYALEVVVCYYQAGLLCHFIRNNYGFSAIKEMLALYKKGKKDAEIIKEVTGLDDEKFDKYFLEWVKKNIFGKMNLMTAVSSREIDDLKDNTEEDPEDVEAYKKLAIAYLQSGRLKDAEINAGYVLALDPENVDGYEILGRVFYRRQKYKKAEELLLQAEELGCKNFYSFLYLGIMYLNQKNIKQAEAYLEKAKKSFPNYVGPSNPYLLLAKIYKARKQTAKYFREIEQFLDKEGNEFKLRIELADHYISQQKYKTASKWLEEALDVFPFDLKFQIKRGKVLTTLKQWQKAISAYKLAIALKPKENVHVLYTDIAELYLKLGNLSEAKSHVESALDLKPGYSRAKKIHEKVK